MSNELSLTAQTWKKRIEEWQASGKSIAQWSRDNNFIYSQSIYWKMRFLGPKNQRDSNLKGFLEIKDNDQSDAGIIIELAKTRLHLTTDFDSNTLVRCIKLLNEFLC
jgi:hypothetical protein